MAWPLAFPIVMWYNRCMAITNPSTIVITSENEVEIVANALASYVDYLTQISQGVEDKADEFTKNLAKEVLGGTLKDTVALRQRIIRQLGYDPTYDHSVLLPD